MGKYILKRLLLMIPIILGVVVFVFTIIYFTPGDATDVLLGADATESERAALREELGLNDSYFVQLGRYMKNAFLHLDLGKSLISKGSVIQELSKRLPHTLLLAVASIVVSLVVGIPLGIHAAVHQNKVGDYGSMLIALLGSSMPGFWLALMLVLTFAYHWDILPAYGYKDWTCWILPIAANAFHGVAMQARQARSSMLDVTNSDYIIMARAKGLKERSVIYKHALPNALIPVITVAGTSFGMSLGGGLVIETVFSIPGMGYYLVSGVNNRDYNVVMGGTIILAIFFSLIMLLTDLLMAAVDPRIKSQFAGKGFKAGRRKHGK